MVTLARGVLAGVRFLTSCLPRMLIPDTVMLANRNVTIPPMTQSGTDVMMAESLPSTPKRNIQAQQAYPALRLAQRVRAMTPLFCRYGCTSVAEVDERGSCWRGRAKVRQGDVKGGRVKGMDLGPKPLSCNPQSP